MKKILILVLIVLLFSACSRYEEDYISLPITNDELDTEIIKLLNEVSDGVGKSYFILPDSDDYLSIPQDPLNPITEEKVRLGKLLLHETAVGGKPKMGENEHQYSCASCHPAAAGFGSGKRQGIGEGGIGFGRNGNGRIINIGLPLDSVDLQVVKVPTLLNLAYQDVMLWNGQFGGTGTNAGTEGNWEGIPENFEGFQGVEVQAMQGQDAHRLLINENFVTSFGYKSLFDAAYPDIPINERYTKKTGGLAIAAFNRTILANEAPWQKYLKGDNDALSDGEKKGAIVFFGVGKCFECHTGPALKDKKFHAFGMGDFDIFGETVVLESIDFENVKKGRGGFTKNTSEDYKFKTPTLYNLLDIGFYGHGSTFNSVKDVIIYKNDGIPQNKNAINLASQFGGLNLTSEQIDNLTVFVERSLKDPNLSRYVPKTINSGFCFPNNDLRSQIDLGCQ